MLGILGGFLLVLGAVPVVFGGIGLANWMLTPAQRARQEEGRLAQERCEAWFKRHPHLAKCFVPALCLPALACFFALGLSEGLYVREALFIVVFITLIVVLPTWLVKKLLS